MWMNEPTHRFSGGADAIVFLSCQNCGDDMADFMPADTNKLVRAFVVCVDCHRLVLARDRLGFCARARLGGLSDNMADRVFGTLCSVKDFEVI